MRVSRLTLSVLSVLLLVGCASPADVRAEHERALSSAQNTVHEAQDKIRSENAAFPGDMATAERWNTHVLGIPAAGWVAIVSIVGAILVIGLSVWATFAVEARRQRRRLEYDLEVERTRTERKRVEAARVVAERGNCQVCGAAPVDEQTLKEINGDD